MERAYWGLVAVQMPLIAGCDATFISDPDPPDGEPPRTITWTANNTGALTYQWSIDPGTGWSVISGSLSGVTVTTEFTDAGTYQTSLSVTCSGGGSGQYTGDPFDIGTVSPPPPPPPPPG